MTSTTRPGPRQRGVSARWVLGGGLALAAAVLLALVGLVHYERTERVRKHMERNELLARVLADQVERALDSTALAAATVADLIARGAQPGGDAVTTALGQTVANLPFLRGLAIVDGRGRIVAGGGSVTVGARVRLEALGRLPLGDEGTVGGFIPGRSLPEPGVVPAAPAGLGIVPYVKAVRSATGERWHVIAVLNPDAFASFQEVTLNDPGSAAALLGFDGRVLASTRSASAEPGRALPTLEPLTRFLPTVEHAGWIGAGLMVEDEIAAFRALRGQPLLVVVGTPRQQVLAVWLAQARGFLLLGGGGVLAIVVMAWLAARSVGAREAARRALDRAQVEVADRERELSLIVRSVRELLFRTDATGTIDFVNARWEVLSGQAHERAVGRSFVDLVAPESAAAVAALFDPDARVGVRQAQARIRRADGVLRSVEFTVVPLVEGARVTGFAGSGADVTDLIGAQAELRAQLAFNTALIENNPLPISVLDLQGRHLRVNRAWEAFTGRSRAEATGQPAHASWPPEIARLHQARDRELLAQGGEIGYEAPALMRDGRQRDVFISKSILPGPGGEPAGIVAVMMDISEFREAERAVQRARDAAESASRAKSEFVANISHELRTPLQSILGFSELGLMRGREQPRLLGMFESIHGAGQRMLALVNDLLDLSKLDSAVGSMQIERHDLRDRIRGVVDEIQPLLTPRALRVELGLSPGALVARVDAARFEQVVRNVLANAIRFSPVGGSIEIEGQATAEGEIRFSVADRGPGIPPDEVEAIFDAFVQSSKTKDGSGGTGLGLAISRRIMTALDGRIWAENRAGGGSIFHIAVPAARFGDTAPAEL